MRLGATRKMVAFHHTGETLAFTGADHVHVFTDAKDLYCQFISGLEPGIFARNSRKKRSGGNSLFLR